MPNRSKQKGDREERDIVNLHREWGFIVERTLESGKRSDGSEPWDITLKTSLGILRGECKILSRGFQMIYKWFSKGDDIDFLTIRQDRGERLYIITESLWKKMVDKIKEER